MAEVVQEGVNRFGDVDDHITNFPDLDNAIDLWLSYDKNKITCEALKELARNKEFEKLRNLLQNRLTFGTAGLRGAMGPGYAQMNDLVIIQTSQGLADYLRSEEKSDMSVVIGYDGRYNSKRFADLTAVAMIQRGIKVYLFSRLCPTPFIPFSVTKYRAKCGVMITASHNPKEDNGYKVYWDNGAQIIPPHDKKIQESILKNLAPWTNAWETDNIHNTCDPWDEVMTDYYQQLVSGSQRMSHNMSTPLSFTYTPMHGVGQIYMEKAFEVAGFKPFISVERQMDPDPEFPTVKFPNPEEGKSALDLAIQTAEKNGCKVILANDPDADRLAVAELGEDGGWKIFNGNELGALLGCYSLKCHKLECEAKGIDPDLGNAYMFASTVSSKFLDTLAKIEGFNFIETLTGFKWMGNEAYNIKQTNPKANILFAYEEAIGFMMGDVVLDKDGISAGIRVAELCATLQAEGLTLTKKLDQIYEQYGYHVSENSYFSFKEVKTTDLIFKDLRNHGSDVTGPINYPKHILDGKYKIISVRDLTTGYDSSKPDKLAILPTSKSSHMITFEFENGMMATLRTSGTEPKVKYYTEFRAPPGEKDLNKIKGIVREMVDAIIQEFLQPERFSLIPRKE